MEILKMDEIMEELADFNYATWQARICRNIRRVRRDLYEKTYGYYKELGIKSPYTSESVSELLGLNHDYYRRLESFDRTNTISLKMLLKLSIILKVDISEFLK